MSHHHHHEHSHSGEDKAFTESNRAHWNDFAKSYNAEQWQKDLLKKITNFIHANLKWIEPSLADHSSAERNHSESKSGRPFKLLDYACGPGTVTNAFQSVINEAVGIDLSENMAEAYNSRFKDTSTTLKAHAVVGNLLNDGITPELQTEEFQNFDLAAVGLGFHHFKNVELATSRLVERLKSGGVLLIIDFVAHGKDFEGPAAHTVAHHGFDEKRIRKIFEDAGLVEFGFVEMDGQVLIRDSPRTPFLARGRKA